MTDTELLDEDTNPIVATDDEKIDTAVGFINETANKTIYKGSIEIGEYLLTHFFNDDIKLAASKSPKKPASFKKLCERDDLTVHPSRLGLMVRVASQERFLLDKKIGADQLSYTHKASLVKMENNPEKINLIQQCIDNNWTTRALDEKIKEAVKLEAPAPKISFARTASKYIKKIGAVLSIDDSAFKIDDDDLASMPEPKRQNLVKQINDLKTKIKENSARSDAIAAGCDDLLSRLEKVAQEDKTEAPLPAEKSTSTAPLK
jgi:hypothetical protein